LGFKKWRLEVNSIGCQECRPYYLRQLKKYYKGKIKQLCPACKKRLERNPLRLLDCKEEKCQRVKKFAPQIVNSLCENCHNHFHLLLEFLDVAGISYILNPYLVRGLDYYEKTVFEIMPESGDGQQSTLIGGGRYDKLIEELGGKPTPAIGAAGGIERIIEEMKEKKLNPDIQKKDFENFAEKPKVFLVQLGEVAKKKSLTLIEDFKKAGMKIGQNIGKDNLRSQLRLAAKANVKYSLILGQKEVLEETIILRNMESGVQELFPLKEIVKVIKKRVKNN
jgi:histidyl-tRNA synthetase